jgi:hypothetical protein
VPRVLGLALIMGVGHLVVFRSVALAIVSFVSYTLILGLLAVWLTWSRRRSN